MFICKALWQTANNIIFDQHYLSKKVSTCDVCDRENAVAICVYCKQSYCFNCSEAHTKISAMKTHLLLKPLLSEQDSRSENTTSKV